MSSAILDLLADPALRQRLARRGRERSRRFTLRATAGRVLEILESIGGAA